jgi:predicted lactoylglutathione lyase
MDRMVFINLPVLDLPASQRFYEALGFTRNPQFSDDAGACMVLTEVIHVMLLTHAKWATFTKRPIPDSGSSEVSIAITCDDRDAVNALVEAGAAQGGTADANPPEDHGFMYQRTIADPDGHIWEPFWMDMASVPAA